MQNILLSGFEEQPNERAVVGDSKITTKLGDLGIVMEPAKGLVQPIIYRNQPGCRHLVVGIDILSALGGSSRF